MTGDTPMQCGPLRSDASRSEHTKASLMRRQREMRAAYPEIPVNYLPPEPVLEELSMAPMETMNVRRGEDLKIHCITQDDVQEARENAFLLGMAIGGAIVMVVLPLTLWATGVIK